MQNSWPSRRGWEHGRWVKEQERGSCDLGTGVILPRFVGKTWIRILFIPKPAGGVTRQRSRRPDPAQSPGLRSARPQDDGGNPAASGLRSLARPPSPPRRPPLRLPPRQQNRKRGAGPTRPRRNGAPTPTARKPPLSPAAAELTAPARRASAVLRAPSCPPESPATGVGPTPRRTRRPAELTGRASGT